jgi:hypothetical protein
MSFVLFHNSCFFVFLVVDLSQIGIVDSEGAAAHFFLGDCVRALPNKLYTPINLLMLCRQLREL